MSRNSQSSNMRSTQTSSKSPEKFSSNMLSTRSSRLHFCTGTNAYVQGLSWLYPHTMFMGSKDAFIPFEFSTDPTTTPEEEFLAEFGEFLKVYKLQQLLGFTTIPTLEGEWIERELPNNAGTIAIRQGTGNARLGGFDEEGITTAWTFLSDRTGVTVKTLRKCSTDSSGGHTT
ncbi:hypothetical protein LTR09_012746 [Extremus antarcticus]|uniref:Uncharacterized protein n=1 Tax=Extremus antarcticus TaxID=702011 RepID=A0AAJ0D4J9_9PEZI|nr:hypothetical protein LTR09_012746 [Extremus antarcticus]